MVSMGWGPATRRTRTQTQLRSQMHLGRRQNALTWIWTHIPDIGSGGQQPMARRWYFCQLGFKRTWGRGRTCNCYLAHCNALLSNTCCMLDDTRITDIHNITICILPGTHMSGYFWKLTVQCSGRRWAEKWGGIVIFKRQCVIFIYRNCFDSTFVKITRLQRKNISSVKSWQLAAFTSR